MNGLGLKSTGNEVIDALREVQFEVLQAPVHDRPRLLAAHVGQVPIDDILMEKMYVKTDGFVHWNEVRTNGTKVKIGWEEKLGFIGVGSSVVYRPGEIAEIPEGIEINYVFPQVRYGGPEDRLDIFTDLTIRVPVFSIATCKSADYFK
jgi:hypothetical protein